MSIFSRFTPISTALLPNAEKDDIALVLKLFLPWNWKKWLTGNETKELENEFKEYFGVKHAISFSSGRAGFYAILKSLREISGFSGPAEGRQNSEVVLQAYTTIALPLAIQKAGLKPVYIDIEENTYNIAPDKIEEKIMSDTKALIVQHTFGIPAEMDKISEIAKRRNLILIEDCAHSLGAEFDGRKVGTFGKAAFFSFGRDKIISSTSGGMVITNDNALAAKIKEYQDNLRFPPRKWILQQLLHPLILWNALRTYYLFNTGKFKIFFDQKIGLISRAYSASERKGELKIGSGYRLPNAMAILALNQFKKLERFNDHRRKLAEIYAKSFHYDNMNYHSRIKLPTALKNTKPVFLYYTVQVEGRDELLKFAARNHIILGDWFPGALGPKGVEPEKFGYERGECPNAEKIGKRSLNLPTNIKTTEYNAKKIVDLIKNFYDNQRNNR